MPDFIKIKIRRGTTADWAGSDPVLADGEIAVDKDKHGLKVGNGTSRWSDLPFCSAEVVNDLITGGADRALSAEQGVVLKGQIDNKASITQVQNIQNTLIDLINNNTVVVEDAQPLSNSADHALSANQGRLLWQKVNSLEAGVGGDGPEIADDLVTNDSGKVLSAKQGVVLKGLVDGKADSSTVTNLQTTVNNIKIVDVANSLTDNSTTKALSAKQGVVLKGLIDEKANSTDITNLRQEITNIIAAGGVTVEDSLESTNTLSALSANKGRELNERINGMSIFGIGYTVDTYNSQSKPTQITFDDGVTAALNWSGTKLQSIVASTGEFVSITYDQLGRVKGRTVGKV